MRILILTPGFAASESDHNCIPPLQSLILEYQAQGADPEVIALAYPSGLQTYSWHGIPVTSVSRRWPRLLRWLNWFGMIRAARRAHRRQAFDVIHSFWLGPCWGVGRWLASRWKIPHWTTLMGQDALPGNPYGRFLRPRHADRLIALSAVQNDCLEQSCGIRAQQVIPWGMDPALTRLRPGNARNIEVLGCGALIPLKNGMLWLETLAELSRTRPDFRAVLIGEGPQRSELEQAARRLGLAEQVQFTGSLPRQAVLEYLLNARVFLHTSRYESFGYVFLEALAAGCARVSTPVGVGPELADCAETALELAVLIQKALEAPLPYPTSPWPSMRETAGVYLQLYGADE